MPSDDIPNQYKLMGENTSIWFIAALLLIGTLGSAATAWLLLPPDLTIATVKSWVVQSNPARRTPEPPLPVNRTLEPPPAMISQKSNVEPAASIDAETLTTQEAPEVKDEVGSMPSPATIAAPMITESMTAMVEHRALAVQQAPVATESEGEHQSSPVASDDDRETISPTPVEAIVSRQG